LGVYRSFTPVRYGPSTDAVISLHKATMRTTLRLRRAILTMALSQRHIIPTLTQRKFIAPTFSANS
jgi:hypothetical protein